MGEVDGKNMIQLATPIEPGNSGGPLVDDDRKVLGIDKIKASAKGTLDSLVLSIRMSHPLLQAFS